MTKMGQGLFSYLHPKFHLHFQSGCVFKWLTDKDPFPWRPPLCCPGWGWCCQLSPTKQQSQWSRSSLPKKHITTGNASFQEHFLLVRSLFVKGSSTLVLWNGWWTERREIGRWLSNRTVGRMGCLLWAFTKRTVPGWSRQLSNQIRHFILQGKRNGQKENGNELVFFAVEPCHQQKQTKFVLLGFVLWILCSSWQHCWPFL